MALAQRGGNRGSKQSGLGCILKVETIGFDDGS